MEDIRKGTCPLCKHNEVLETAPVEEGSAGNLEPLAAHITQKSSIFIAGTSRSGIFTAYVCRACGYSQWFAQNPAAIPVGEGTRVLKGPEPEGPYR